MEEKTLEDYKELLFSLNARVANLEQEVKLIKESRQRNSVVTLGMSKSYQDYIRQGTEKIKE